MAPTTIEALNDDCLYLILKKLEIRELILLEEVSTQFCRVAHMVYRTQKELDFFEFGSYEEPLSMVEAENIVQRVGPHVHTLKMFSGSFGMRQLVPELIPVNCRNLQKIFFYGLNKEVMERLFDICVGIKEVHLFWNKFSEDIGNCFRNSTQLEVITLSINDQITGQCLIGLKGIKEINLQHCNQIEPQFFKEFLISNPQLQRIRLLNCSKIDSRCLYIISTLVHLESLEVDLNIPATYADFVALANLPRLRSLKIEFNYFYETYQPHMEVLLSKLSINVGDRLEVLSVHGLKLTTSNVEALMCFTKLKVLDLGFSQNMVDSILLSLPCKTTLEELNVSGCRKVTPHGLVEFVKECKGLKKLDISCSPQYGMEFLKKLAPLIDRKRWKLKILAIDSFFSSMECDEIELAEFLKTVQEKIELTFYVG